MDMAIACAAVASLGSPEGEGILPGLGMILITVLILLMIAALPLWPYSRSWGYGPVGGMGLILAVVGILVLTGEV